MEQENTVEDLLKELEFGNTSHPNINEYTKEYIHGLLTELKRLKALIPTEKEEGKDTEKSVFILSHKGNVTMPDGDISNDHVMFKLILNQNTDEYKEEEGKKTIAWVYDGEGNRLYGYEFLIEFDLQDFGYGIYYGCKIIIPYEKPDAEVATQIERIKEIWQESRKAELAKVLTNIFDGISFEKKLIPTTNANNNTFWPFWIRLNENEDVLEVAAMATLFIARFCLAKEIATGVSTDCLLGDLPKTTDLHLDKLFDKKKKKPIYYFTEERWKDIKKNDKSINTIEDVQTNLDTAVKALVDEEVLTQKLDEYEYAWQFNPEYNIPINTAKSKYKLPLNNIVCIHLIKNLWDALRGETPENKQEEPKPKQKNMYLLNQIWLMPSGERCDNPGHTMQTKLEKNPVDVSKVIKNHLNKTLEKKVK